MRLKKLQRLVYGRTLIVIAALLIQFFLFYALIYALSLNYSFIYALSIPLALGCTLFILNDKKNPSFKLVWVIPILLFPIFGTLFYIYTRAQLASRLMNKRLGKNIAQTKVALPQDEETLERLGGADLGERNLAIYMNQYSAAPAFDGTKAAYFPSGEAKFTALKEELEKARDFIFMEYFIIERGVMWDALLEILARKAGEGVEVRLMYDGMCSLSLLPRTYPKTLRALGIECRPFLPISPVISTVQNNRDHRKITVIDGKVAFTGGVNFADEYINEKPRFGHWRDSAIMLEGPAANSFTCLFLQIWNTNRANGHDDYAKYLRHDSAHRDVPGYFMPYGDSPLDDEQLARNVYIDIISRAKKYIHITTPYLIPDNEMLTALQYAAKRGVETIVVMPHVPDKKTAYYLARTFYPELLTAGVRIFEYTPGFMHAKMFVSDDVRAVVGTINIDFRSLYLHFECGVYCYQSPVIADIEADYQDILQKCEEISLKNCKDYRLAGRIAGWALRLFAPLM